MIQYKVTHNLINLDIIAESKVNMHRSKSTIMQSVNELNNEKFNSRHKSSDYNIFKTEGQGKHYFLTETKW